MKGRKPTKEEAAWMDAMAARGCIICRKFLGVFSPAEIHHKEGRTKAEAHLWSMPLCPRHHRIKSNEGEWVSRHGDGRIAFEKAYGKEKDLIEMARQE